MHYFLINWLALLVVRCSMSLEFPNQLSAFSTFDTIICYMYAVAVCSALWCLASPLRRSFSTEIDVKIYYEISPVFPLFCSANITSKVTDNSATATNSE